MGLTIDVISVVFLRHCLNFSTSGAAALLAGAGVVTFELFWTTGNYYQDVRAVDV